MKEKTKNRLFTTVILIVAVVAIVEVENAAKQNAGTCGSCSCYLPPELIFRNSDPRNTLTSEQTTLPRLIDFSTDQYTAGKMMTTVLEELAGETKSLLRIDFINTGKDNVLTEQYGIRTSPTLLFLDKDETELYRHEGFMSKEDILKKWTELGIDLTEQPGEKPATPNE